MSKLKEFDMERVKTDFTTSVTDIYERDAIVVHADYVTSVDLVDQQGSIRARLNMVQTSSGDFSVDIIPLNPRSYIQVKSWHDGVPILSKILDFKDLVCTLIRKPL